MDSRNYQESQSPAPDPPPPYSEKQPYNEQPPLGDGPANPAMPTPYQLYYVPYGALPGQTAIVQAPQHITFIARVQPTHEPDYLAYSIFTMIFCFLPLGIAALIFSIQTRDANRAGNGTDAKRSSRMARILASSALAVGVAFISVFILVVMTTSLGY